MVRTKGPLATLVAASLTAGALTMGAAPAAAAIPSPILSYDFSTSAGIGSSVAAGGAVADSAGTHPGTVRGAGATVVAGPRGSGAKALRLPVGSAGSAGAVRRILPWYTCHN